MRKDVCTAAAAARVAATIPPAAAAAGAGRVAAAMAKPRIAITVGDPAGIGPEIARKAAEDARVREVCEPVLYGPPEDSKFTPGVLSAEAGQAAYESICAAVRDAQAGTIAAIATAPINKLAFSKA